MARYNSSTNNTFHPLTVPNYSNTHYPIAKNARPCLDVHSWYFGMSLNYCVHLYVHVQRGSKGSGRKYNVDVYVDIYIVAYVEFNLVILYHTPILLIVINVDINVLFYVVVVNMAAHSNARNSIRSKKRRHKHRCIRNNLR